VTETECKSVLLRMAGHAAYGKPSKALNRWFEVEHCREKTAKPRVEELIRTFTAQ